MQRISNSQSSQHHVQWPRACPGTGEEQPACSQPPPPLTLPSPSHQLQQLMVRGSPAGGQNMNVALQGMGPGLKGIPQVTLAPLPLPSPTSPGFQFGTQPWQFEHRSPWYIQPSPGPGQALQNVRAGAPGPGLGLCSSSPTGGFVDASVLVRQISLSPSSGGHFVFQDGSGLTQIAQGAQVQLQHPGTPITVRERRPSQPHTQSGGTIHHLGPQSPAAAGGAGLQPLASPSHITANLPPQISSIIQGQLVQQQQVLQGLPLSRPLGFERTPGVLLPGAGGAAGFGMMAPPPPTSPSRTAVPPGLSSLPLTSVGNAGVKKAPKKLEEIPPASLEMAQMRKQCLDYHYQEMQALKEVFKEYLIELFFLQHFQGNMMDFLAFKERLYGPLQAYLRQNDLDIEEEEEEHFEVINDEVTVLCFGASWATERDSRPHLEVGHPGMGLQHLEVTSGVPLQQSMPTAQSICVPKYLAGTSPGWQSQQQYNPSTGPPVQNAASLHTPLPQLPGRLPTAGVCAAASLQVSQQRATEPQAQPPVQGRTQQPIAVPPPLLPGWLSAPPPQAVQLALHLPTQGQAAPRAPSQVPRGAALQTRAQAES
uniref:E1A-binding protein p400 N-terminal domain-containing protein n=1 Tax=Theropithecus gelada TaxID=9565 RepID=A0A8D2GB47_THEGE